MIEFNYDAVYILLNIIKLLIFHNLMEMVEKKGPSQLISFTISKLV